ncbi:MAG: phosphotransferase family protein [Myxococcales bacterium]|nr:phosphotransferase family protein [Myxococcales bacterium]
MRKLSGDGDDGSAHGEHGGHRGTAGGGGESAAAATAPTRGDEARPVRDGEQLDANALLAYLRQHDLVGAAASLQISQFPAGHSNLTYLLRAGERELVLRRPPFGSKVKTAHDMGREFRVLSGLGPVFDKVPRVLHHCDDTDVIGAPFYLMDRVRGVILRKDPPAHVKLDAEAARGLCEAFVDTLVALHAVDPEAANLADFGKPAGYIRRQVEGWTRRYRDSQTDEIAAIDRVAAWLAANMPDVTRAAIIHNDFKFDNLVLDPDDVTQVRTILDWEMSTLGDPLMDLGTTLCYWVEAADGAGLAHFRFGPTHLPGMMSRREIAERYLERSGRGPLDDGELLFYYCFGLFKTAVVVQQIYYRYKKGLTQDERFARFILGVQVLAQHAEAFIGRGSI